MAVDHSDRGAWIWSRIGLESRGAPFSVKHVCAAAVAEADVDGAAVTLMATASAWQTLYATDAVAERLEEWQLDFGEGPTIDAFKEGGPVLVPDMDSLDALTRWPVFVAEASRGGLKAVFALPLQVGAIRLGVFNLYRGVPGPMDARQVADALAFADAACTLLLSDAEGTRSAADITWHRDDRSGHQIQVHQATGMVLVQLGVTAEIALARLRAYAYAHGRPLGDVARDVVERRLRFEPDVPKQNEEPV